MTLLSVLVTRTIFENNINDKEEKEKRWSRSSEMAVLTMRDGAPSKYLPHAPHLRPLLLQTVGQPADTLEDVMILGNFWL